MNSTLSANLALFIESRGTDFVPTSVSQVTVSAPMTLYQRGLSPDTVAQDLDKLLKIKDETFSQMLCRKIRETGMTNAQCYRKACIDRRIFSKILSDIHYRPQKKTALAFALALELSLEETEELLMKAGYAFSDSQVFDLIIKYFLKNRTYDIFFINQVLWERDQPLLGDSLEKK